MELREFLPLFQRPASDIRAQLDSDINAGLDIDDPRWVDTREGSFYWDITEVLILELARLWDALAVEVPASAFPILAWGEYLDNHAAVFGLERKAAVPAEGIVLFAGDAATLVSTGTVVSTEPATEDSDVIEFTTTASGTTSAQLDPPANLILTPSASGGDLASGSYFYRVTAVSAYGETDGGTEVEATVVGPTGKVHLDWDNVTGAVAYRAYRARVSGDLGIRIYEGASSVCDDTVFATTGATGPPDLNLSAGVRLAVEAVVADTASNVASNAISDLDSPNPGIDFVTNEAATGGGTDVESDEALRQRIILEFEGRGPGNRNDYKRWALAYPGVGRVFVNPVWDGPGTVQVVVMTEDGDPVATGVVTGLQAVLDPTSGLGDGDAPISAIVTVQTSTAVDIDVVAVVAFETGYSLDGAAGTIALRSQIEDTLRSYINNLDVGEDVVYNHVLSRFFEVRGVHNVSGLTVEGGTADVALTSDPPQIARLAEPPTLT